MECVGLIGDKEIFSDSLRPIVSIDVASSGCAMIQKVDDAGNMTIYLKFGDN